MNPMLEKMAEAMWSVKTTDDAFPLAGTPETEPTWRGLPESERARWRYRARAALLAIREPSENVREVGVTVLRTDPHNINPYQAWSAMIDATLKDAADAPN